LDKSALLPDGIHPNKEGLGIMAAEVAKAIK
jgi:lysophospholipase L1-like esterase